MEITHGKASTYTNWGCRCDECKAAAAEERKRRSERGLEPGDERHGTTSGYVTYGCRCDECRRAWADYNAKARDRRRSELAASMAQSRNGFGS